MRVGDAAVALVAGQVPGVGAQRLAPAQRVALVAGVAEIGGVGHGRHVPAQQVRGGAVAAARQDQGGAGDVLLCAVRAVQAGALDAAGAVGEQGLDVGAGQDGDAGGLGRGQQPGHQGGTGALGDGVHAVAAVAGIQEAVQHRERDAVAVGQPLQRRAGGGGDAQRLGRVGLPGGLAGDVGGKQGGGVVDALGALEPGAGGGDEAGRQRGGPGGRAVAFQHGNLRARIMGGQGGNQAARAGADDEDLDVGVGAHGGDGEDTRRRRLSLRERVGVRGSWRRGTTRRARKRHVLHGPGVALEDPLTPTLSRRERGQAPPYSSSRVTRARTSRLPTWLAAVMTPSFSICSISLAARL